MRLLSPALRQLDKFKPRMSFTPSFQYINARDLAEIVKKNQPKEVQVIDVRDDDFVGECKASFQSVRHADDLGRW